MATNPIILAFDCALAGCTVALDQGNGRIVSRYLDSQREQAAKLIPIIQEVLTEAEVTFGALTHLVTTVGPGSFTGLRLGLAAAKSLSLALTIPAIGVTTLDLAAKQALPQAGGKDMLILLETKRADYYGQYFDAAGRTQGDAFALPGEQIEAGARYLSGDAANRFIAETGWRGAYSQMERLSPDLLIAAGKEKLTNPAEALTPLYLRGADISESKKKPIKIKGDIASIL